MLSHVKAPTHTKGLTTSVINCIYVQIKLLTTRFYHLHGLYYLIKMYVPIIMSLLIQIATGVKVFWFWKLFILHQNQKDFLLSSLQRFRGFICSFFKTNLFTEWIKKYRRFIALLTKKKWLRMNGKMMTLAFFELSTVYIKKLRQFFFHISH